MKEEYRKVNLVNEPVYKMTNMLVKSSKTIFYFWTCQAGITETCNQVAEDIFRVKATFLSRWINPSYNNSKNND